MGDISNFPKSPGRKCETVSLSRDSSQMHLLPDSGLSPERSSPSLLPTPAHSPAHSPPHFTWSPYSGAATVPEASLTCSALFSGAPSPSLPLQGEWRPLSHPPILPCPHSTPWRTFPQPPSCLPCVVALYDKPQWEGGRERPER